MAVNVKMGVDLGGFKSGIREGQQILKGLNAEMKSAEAEFKATGNAEQLMANKTRTLTSQMNVQKGIIDQTQQALKMMTDAGIDPADAAYQKLYAQMMNAQAGMYESQAALNALGQGANEAAAGADKLTSSVQGISKKISLEQVIGGIDKITTGLENAAKKAVDLGEKLWNTIMDSARRADDTATMAEMYGIDLDTFMRMEKLVAGGMDTTVEAILKSQDKLKKGVGKDSKEVMEVLRELHVGMREGVLEDWTSWKQKDPQKLFWEVGQAIMAMGDAYDQEAAAQTVFGRSWKELVPLFNTYKSLEEYNAALEAQTVNSEETIRDLTALNDAVSKLEGSWTTLKDEMLGAVAPALTKGADAISSLLEKLTEYLKTDKGQKMLENLSTAVSSLFDDLGKIDPEKVVGSFVELFSKITGGIQWLVENKDTAAGVLGTIVAGWGALKIGGSVLQIINLVNGLKGLTGATAAAQAAGTAAGSAYATGFVNAFVAAAPVLASFLGVTAIAIAPAVAAQKNDEKRWAKEEQRMLQAAQNDANNRDFLTGIAKNRGYDFSPDSASGYLYGLSSRQNQSRAELFNMIRQYAPYTAGYSTTDLLLSFWSNPNGEQFDAGMVNELLSSVSNALARNPQNTVKLPTELQPEDSAAAKLSEQVGTVNVNAVLQVSGIDMGGYGGGGGAGVNVLMKKANGIPFVPYDGYLAALHKGEQVVPAREVSNRSFSSNLYVENMNMGGGMDANALAAVIASRNQRMMAGYGS